MPSDPPGPASGRDTLALTDAAARGDVDAIHALLERHLPDLQAFVRLRAGKLLRGRESSSDLVQSVCREVLENMDGFRHPSEGAFKHWLFTTAMRKLSDRRDYLLAGKRDVLREVPLESPLDARASETGSLAGKLGEASLLERYRRFSSPSQRAELADEIARIERVFDQLTEEHREVVTLAHVVGLTRAEIGERMEKSEGAVRVLLHRALARVSELLAAERRT